jgi:tRNA pseudouridine13 synthase
MTQAGGDPARIEADVLAGAGLSAERLAEKSGERIDGARRPLRVPPQDARFEIGRDRHGSYLELGFTLPPGSYATVLVREISKRDPC